jgi:hypothetical protein
MSTLKSVSTRKYLSTSRQCGGRASSVLQVVTDIAFGSVPILVRVVTTSRLGSKNRKSQVEKSIPKIKNQKKAKKTLLSVPKK